MCVYSKLFSMFDNVNELAIPTELSILSHHWVHSRDIAIRVCFTDCNYPQNPTSQIESLATFSGTLDITGATRESILPQELRNNSR